jgi:WD40 repeat protein
LSSITENGGQIVVTDWDIGTGVAQEVARLGLGTDEHFLTASPDGRAIVSMNTVRKSLTLRDTATGQPVGSSLLAPPAIAGFATNVRGVLDERGLLAVAGNDSVWLFDTAATDPALGKTVPLGAQHGHRLQVSPDGQTVAVLNYSTHSIAALDANGSLLPHQPALEFTHEGDPYIEGIPPLADPVAIDPSGRLAIVGVGGLVRTWDPASGALGSPLEAAPSCAGGPVGLTFTSDGRALIGDCLSSVVVWDAASRRVRFVTPRSFFVLVSRTTLVSDGQVWDLATGAHIGDLPPEAAEPGVLAALAISADGTAIAWADSISTVAVWEVGAGVTRTVTAPGLVVSLALSPDGATLATGAQDGSVQLWDVGSLEPLGAPLAGRGVPSSLTFSPDGRALWSGGPAEPLAQRDPLANPVPPSVAMALFRWDVDLGSWETHACAIANRNLTREEWNRFVGTAEAYRKTCPDLP